MHNKFTSNRLYYGFLRHTLSVVLYHVKGTSYKTIVQLTLHYDATNQTLIGECFPNHKHHALLWSTWGLYWLFFL